MNVWRAGLYEEQEWGMTNLVARDTNAKSDVFVHNRTTGQTTRISVTPSGAQGSGDSLLPAISGNGGWVSFISTANNLVTADTNNTLDVFVRSNP
jgi:hypothetical protein